MKKKTILKYCIYTLNAHKDDENEWRVDESSSKSVKVDEYSNAQETWGKKDPATPKRNPKVGQFQWHGRKPG
jgi:hypothetical protein